MIVNNFVDTIIFFIVYLLSLISIAGYGIILNNLLFKGTVNTQQNINIFSSFFLGLPFLMVAGFINYILFGYHQVSNVLIIIFGILGFFYNFKLSNNFFKSFIIPAILFIGILISKGHTDFQYYHFQHLKELVNGKLDFGLGNLALRYGHSSLFSYVQGFFYLPAFGLKLFHIPVYLIFVSFVSYLYEQKNKIKNLKMIFLVCFVLILLPFQFTRLSEFGYDYIGQFVLIYLLIDHLIAEANKSKNSNLVKTLIMFVFAICIKITSIFFIPIIFWIIFKNKKNKIIHSNNIKSLFFISILVITFIGTSFIKTGCVFYGVKTSCFSKERIIWTVPYENIKTERDFANLWAKSYFHQDQNSERIDSKNLYLSNFNWVKNWIDKHFFYKISELLARIAFVFFLLYFFCLTEKKEKYFSKDSMALFSSALLGVIFWFCLLPQYRFGFATILVATCCLLLLFVPKTFKINHKRVNFLILVTFIFFSFKNINRINESIKSENFYKFITIPWYKLPDRDYTIIYNSEQKISYYVPNEFKKDFVTNGIGWYCWNIPSPCSENRKKIKISKHSFFTIIHEL